jgi:lipid II:glycine glycyltransferase (peptidoglycan interpeptide bridge formation enzyme)
LNYEAEAPYERVRGKEQAKKYMKNNRAFGIVIDIPKKIYYKSGSRRNPAHSVSLEIIPAVKEVLEEWKRSKGGAHY